MARADGTGRGDRRVRAHRTRRRLGCPCDQDDGQARRRRVGDRWLEGVHHQLGDAADVGDHRGGAGRGSRRRRRLDDRRAGRDARTHGGASYRKVGWRASDTHEVSFDACRVPADHLLGERGRGYSQFLETLADGRVAIAALSVGLARGCLEESVRYAGEREAFGQPIGAYQALQFKIADMRVGVETGGSRTSGPRGSATEGAPSRPRRRSPSCTRARSRSRARGRPSRSTAATGSSRTSPWPASTGTPRCSRSGRAPARSSACSSPGRSACPGPS